MVDGVPLLAVGLVSGPLSGRPILSGRARAARRAGVAAYARHAAPGQASTSTEASVLDRAWARPRKRVSGRAAGLRAAWTSIVRPYLQTHVRGTNLFNLAEHSNRTNSFLFAFKLESSILVAFLSLYLYSAMAF